MDELINSASKQYPLLIINIYNGKAINTFTCDVAKNGDIYHADNHYDFPGIYENVSNDVDVINSIKAVDYYTHSVKVFEIIQLNTYWFMGHSPADTEHECGIK